MNPLNESKAGLAANPEVANETRIPDRQPAECSCGHPPAGEEGFDLASECFCKCHENGHYRMLPILQEGKSYSLEKSFAGKSDGMDQVRKLIVETIPNLAEMSRRIGKNHAYLQQFIKRGTPVELPENVREALAQQTGLPIERFRTRKSTVPDKKIPENVNPILTTPIDHPIAPRSHHDAPFAQISGAALSGERDLPVFGIAQGGRGAMILSNEAVDMVVRPEPLLRVRDGYGVIVVEDSMFPEFESGDIALVNPHLPPRPGDTCIFRHQDEDGGETACIKRLRRITEASWQVTEWHSEDGNKRDFNLKRSEWQLCHVTVGSYKRR